MFYIFLPFFSAALYGLSYIMTDKLLKGISVPTFMMCSMILNTLFMTAVFGVMWRMRPDIISLDFLSDKKTTIFFLVTSLISIIAWSTTLLGLQNTSASYVSFAEISYPVFTVLFLFFLFGERHFSWQFLLGGALILAGSVVLVMSQLAIKK